MAYKLIVNIKDKKTGAHLENIEALYKQERSANYLYQHALDKIQNYFGRYLKPFEIWQGKNCSENHMYWSVKPQGKNKFATIVIDKV